MKIKNVLFAAFIFPFVTLFWIAFDVLPKHEEKKWRKNFLNKLQNIEVTN